MIDTKSIYVSIILPVLNRDRTVVKSVKSILSQSYKYFEIIIVDDGSTDETRKVIQSLADSRIRYLAHSKTRGASAARNTGINHAQYDWIAFQDSDDIWLPDKLEKQVKLLKEKLLTSESLPIIYTSFYRYKNGTRECIPGIDQRTKEGNIHKELLLGNFISTQTVLLPKKSLVNVGGFSEDMPRFQDWELWLRLSQENLFYWIDEPLVEVYYTQGSISSSQKKIIQAYDKIIDKHESLFHKAGSEYMASILFSSGHNLCLSGEMKRGREKILKSLKKHRTKTKSYLALAASLVGVRFYRWLYSIYER